MADKKKALETALLQIEKNYGKGAVMRLGESGALNIEAIPTGSISLDTATGIGGLPRGRIVEIYGPESSGKTTLALQVVAEAQKMGGEAAFIDAEHALDPEYAQNLGVDVNSLLVSQPDNGEQALEIAEYLARSGALDVIVVDSVAALVPKAEIEGEMGDSHVGLHARLMSQALRKLTGAISSALSLFLLGLRSVGWVNVEAENFEQLKAMGVTQTPEALDAFWLIYALIPALGYLASYIVWRFYKLNDKDVQIMAKCNAGEITKEEALSQLSRKY